MFYVFGLGGPIYRGTMENLADLSPVRALSATRALHRSDALHRDAFELPPATPRPRSASVIHNRRRRIFRPTTNATGTSRMKDTRP